MLFVLVVEFGAPSEVAFDLFEHLPLQIAQLLGVDAERLFFPGLFFHQNLPHFLLIEFGELQPASHTLRVCTYKFAFVNE